MIEYVAKTIDKIKNISEINGPIISKRKKATP